MATIQPVAGAYRKPTAPIQQTSEPRGRLTHLLLNITSLPALALGDMWWRGCQGLLRTSVHGGQNDCWDHLWYWYEAHFIRTILLIGAIASLVLPEFLLNQLRLVRQTIYLDVWIRFRVRIIMSYAVLVAFYVWKQPGQSAFAESLKSPLGYLAFCAIVSAVSMYPRHAIYSYIHDQPFPEFRHRSGFSTFYLMAFFGWASMVVTNVSNVAVLIAVQCLINELADVFDDVVRPAVTSIRDRDTIRQKRGINVTIALAIMPSVVFSIIFFALRSTSADVTVRRMAAMWYTFPGWVLLPWALRSLGHAFTLRTCSYTRYVLWHTPQDLEDLCPVVGVTFDLIASLFLYPYTIWTFYGYRPVAWFLTGLFIVTGYSLGKGVFKAYLNGAPRRAGMSWVAKHMRTMDANDPRLINDVCSICFGPPGGRDEARLTPCGHLYHVACLSTWLFQQATCPTCRRQIRPTAMYPFSLPA